MLARDDLRIRTMAQYKAVKAGDAQMFQDIENQMIDLALCKGLAFEDSSIEEFERGVDSDLEDRGLNNPDCHFGRRSQNSELLGSVAASQDYW